MSNQKLRIGIIGVGSWANRVHIPQVLSHPNAELVALSARTQEKLKTSGDEFGVKRLYADYEELLAQDDLDAVTISATHNAHFEIAKAALERGLHVFCEKPLGINSQQTGELAQLAETAGVKTMVAFTNRWVPEAMYARRLMQEGYCGEVFHYNNCQLAGYGRPGGNWMWRADPKLSGGGVLFDLGCHNIDLAMWLNGPITAVCATLKTTSPQRPRDGKMLPTPGDDTDAFIAHFENGTQGIFHISWTCPGDRIMRHEIAGSEGRLQLNLYHDVWVNGIMGVRAREPDLAKLSVPDELQGSIPRAVGTPEQRDIAHKAFLFDSPSIVRAFIDCIVNDTEASPSFADGHATQRVMDAILLSDREGKWVEVEGLAVR